MERELLIAEFESPQTKVSKDKCAVLAECCASFGPRADALRCYRPDITEPAWQCDPILPSWLTPRVTH